VTTQGQACLALCSGCAQGRWAQTSRAQTSLCSAGLWGLSG
jgi:hypothetical protein